MHWRNLIEAYLNLLYPPCCLQCEGPTTGGRIFCDPCGALLDLLEVEGRCSQCFIELGNAKLKVCRSCRQLPSVWRHAGAALDYAGPAAILVKRLKYAGQQHLAFTAAAFLVAQLHRLDWPLPDVIVPVPMPPLRRFLRGYNHSQLIAQELGRLLQVTVMGALSRGGTDFVQAGKTFGQRQRMSSGRFALKKKVKIADYTVLLVDDVFTTGTTLRCCAEALLAGYPKDIYALSVCRATL